MRAVVQGALGEPAESIAHGLTTVAVVPLAERDVVLKLIEIDDQSQPAPGEVLIDVKLGFVFIKP